MIIVKNDPFLRFKSLKIIVKFQENDYSEEISNRDV